MFDAALIETGSGGDVQIIGNDLAIIYGIENQPYLAMFGGNIEADTISNVVQEQSFDYWANTLLMPNNQTTQFNSKLERALLKTALTSSGRIKIVNAVTQDLQYIKDSLGDNININVQIVDDNRIQVTLKITVQNGTRVIIINYRKQAADGDFYLFDFNDDFY